ncbi:MAG: glycerophosphodiester phosphodiesterase [Proteobacteria bacterium]|nr:glycerophosphodiester phosphodiesterase [Pseudomonadota bacterium]MBU6425541.1 glycerophosphodiester phosphodiesterase [Rhodospirillales bacterium]
MIAVFGHRGARGLLPENTLAGMALAARLQLTGVEFDIGMTADGIAVVHHDARPNPDIARNSAGIYAGGDAPLIRDLTFQQLATYDVGQLRTGSAYAARFPAQVPVPGARVPALAELLTSCASLETLIEIKTYPDHPATTQPPEQLVEAVVRALRQAGGMAKAMICAFDWRVLEEVAKLEPALRRCCLTEPQTVRRSHLWFGKTNLEAFGGSVPRAVAASGAVAWSAFHESLDEAQIDEARRLGLAVLAWTVNEPADIHRMISLGVDGIISDRPDLVKEVLAGCGIGMTPARER